MKSPTVCFHLASALVVFFVVAPSSAISSEWAGGTGDWFDPTNWDNAVPSETVPGRVPDGEAHFSLPAESAGLAVGTRPRPFSSSNGAVIGEADLSIVGDAIVGEMSGTGTDRRYTGTGAIAINGGDLRMISYDVQELWRGQIVTTTIDPLLFIGRASGTGTRTFLTGDGTVSVSDGSVVTNGSVRIGLSQGTGNDTTFASRGVLRIENGSLEAKGPVFIANSYRTSTGKRPSYGELTVLGGDIRAGILGIGFAYNTEADDLAHGKVKLFDGDLFTDAIGIGTSGGSGDGDAYGELIVENGNIFTGSFTIGSAHYGEGATGHGEGSVKLLDGSLEFSSLALGFPLRPNMATASGTYEQHRGITTGGQLTVWEGSRLVLGIEGAVPGNGFAQIQVNQAAIHGVVEARFDPLYSPTRNDFFDLILGDSISGDYALEVTGIDLNAYPNFSVVRTATLLRLSFVPEPNSFVLLVLTAASMAIIWRRKNSEESLKSSYRTARSMA